VVLHVQHRDGAKSERAVTTYRALVRTAHAMDELLGTHLSSFELTTTQFRVLDALLEAGPLSQARIADLVGCGDSTITVAARVLAKRGLLVRRAGQRDRRETTAHLTPQGRQLVTEVAPLHAKVVRAQMRALTFGQQEALRRLCQKLEKGDPRGFLLEITTVDSG
jgi:MarR family 2-MHQ and catechol resistance regulon transcriptional repressor